MKVKGMRESRTFMEIKDIEDVKPEIDNESLASAQADDALFRQFFDEFDNRYEHKVVRVIKEIYISEKLYLEHLRKLSEARSLVASLKSKNSKKKSVEMMVSQEDLAKIFIDIKALQNIHAQILHKLVSIIKSHAELEKKDIYEFAIEISGVFTTMSPLLAMYTLYIQRFETSVLTLHQLRDSMPSFDKATYAIEGHLKLTLLNLINKPVQRITKYPILLKALDSYVIKLSSQSVNDRNFEQVNKLHSELKKAKKILQDSVKKVNDKLKIASEMGRMLRLNDEIGAQLTEKNLLMPWRRIQHEVTVSHYRANQQDYRDTVVYILNDFIIATQLVLQLRKTPSLYHNRRSSTKSKLFVSGAKARTPSLTSVGSAKSRSSARFSLFTSSVKGSASIKPVRTIKTVVSEIKVEQVTSTSLGTEIIDEFNYHTLRIVYDDIFGDNKTSVWVFFEDEGDCKEIADVIEKVRQSLMEKQEADREYRLNKFKGGNISMMSSFGKLL